MSVNDNVIINSNSNNLDKSSDLSESNDDESEEID